MSDREIFDAALAVPDPAERAAYLDRACAADTVRRKHIEGLLEMHGQLGSFLEAPAHAQPATIHSSDALERPGAIIGPYKLLQQIGEGGMGVVFMAEQTEPVKRLVAIKIVKPSLDSKQVIARFEAERQALALMDHANIARVLDAGTTATGRPYFVMELVKGVPITRYCDEHHLMPSHRLELFVQVCQAVQHAHQKGIIHRDLKPSNVLVCQYDGRPVPKVIDFGVAKAAGPRLTEKTLFTELGQVVGTLEYMSPEQAELNQLDVDTRSDVYSLGVLLYELLTGTTPLERKRLKEAALLEVLRLIREEEPQRPSTRLSTVEELPSIAANRGLEPKKLSVLVRGELDWIVMKALDKDRNRRYETANAFAMDLQRYLSDEPVQAGPSSAWYRVRKFARRHRPGLLIASLILACITLLGGSIGWIMRDKAARRAQTAGDIDVALREAQMLQQQLKWPEALAVVKHALVQLSNVGGDEDLHKRLRERVADLEMAVKLEDAHLRRTEAKEGGSDVERIAIAYAQAFREYGVDVEKLDPPEAGALLRARSIAVELAAALDTWVWMLRTDNNEVWRSRLAAARVADPDPFRDHIREAVARGDRKALEDLAAAEQIADLPAPTLVLMAHGLEGSNAWARIVALLQKAQRRHPGDFWVNFQLALYLTAVEPPQTEEALRFNTAALALRPHNPMVHNNLGTSLKKKGRLDDAIAEYREAIYLKKDDAPPHSNLGSALMDKGQLDEAIAECREAIRLDKEDGRAHNTLATALHAKGQLDEAIAECREAIRLKKDFAAPHTNLGNSLLGKGRLDDAIVEYREAIRLDKNMAQAHYNLGNALAAKGQSVEAIAEYREAVGLKNDFPDAHVALGNALHSKGRLDEAIAEYREAIRLKKDFVGARSNLGNALYAKGRLDEAIAEYREAIRLDKNFVGARNNLGNALQAKGQLDEAIAEWREAIRLKKDYAPAHRNLGAALITKGAWAQAIEVLTETMRVWPNMAKTRNDLAWLLANCPNPEFRDPARAVELAKKAVELAPKEGSYWNTLGTAQYAAGDWKAAVDALDKSIGLRRGGDANDWFFLAMARWQLGDKKDAHKWYDQAVQWMEKHQPKNEELARFRAEAEKLLEPKK